MTDWAKYYEELNLLYKQREEIRRKYDHYDEKLEKIIKSRDEKAFKKIPETQQDLAKFDRVFILYLTIKIFRMKKNIEMHQKIILHFQSKLLKK